MTVGQSEARSDMALRLLSYDSRAARRRLRNKEEVLMEWTSLWIIGTFSAAWGIFALHLIWRE